jgi:hypothetical protein
MAKWEWTRKSCSNRCSYSLRRSYSNSHRIFERQLQRGQQRSLSDVLRDDLIDGGSVVDVRAGGLLRFISAQKSGRYPVIGAGLSGRRFGRFRPESTHDHGVLAKRLQRLKNHRVFEIFFAWRTFRFARATRFRHPPAGRSAVWDEDAGKTSLGVRRGLGKRSLRWKHGVQQR